PSPQADPPPIAGGAPGPGKSSIRKTPANVGAGGAPAGAAASPVPAPGRKPAPAPPRKKAEPQQSLPITIAGYTIPQVSLLEKREQAGVIDRKVLADTGRRIAAKCAEFGVEGEVAEYHPGPVVTTY